MKFINRKTAVMILISSLAVVTLGGCQQQQNIDNAFNIYEERVLAADVETGQFEFFSKNLCVTSKKNINVKEVQSDLAGAAGVFNVQEKEVLYGKNLFKQMYPASITKILTAYLALTKSSLDDKVTVSENAVKLPSGASSCNLRAGDVLTMNDLLHGLMLESGNDAAIAIAEYISGSVDEFAKLMNETAASMGATHSHFVNPNGIHNDNHYTTIYDTYLIFQNAIKNEEFVNLISCVSYDAAYEDKNGTSVTETYQNTNGFINGKQEKPEGCTVVGGKTGTTNDAGRCLILLSYNAEDEPIISIVFKAETSDNLYYFMKILLEKFSNL